MITIMMMIKSRYGNDDNDNGDNNDNGDDDSDDMTMIVALSS